MIVNDGQWAVAFPEGVQLQPFVDAMKGLEPHDP
jgi:hypothetical protein